MELISSAVGSFGEATGAAKLCDAAHRRAIITRPPR
jgi:hypothetical protein